MPHCRTLASYILIIRMYCRAKIQLLLYSRSPDRRILERLRSIVRGAFGVAFVPFVSAIDPNQRLEEGVYGAEIVLSILATLEWLWHHSPSRTLAG